MGLTPDQRKVLETASRFRAEVIGPMEPHRREWIEDPHERFPWEAVEEGSRRGLRTLAVPRDYGGAGASVLELCLAVEEIAAGDMGLAVIFDQVWKITTTINDLATPEQKEWFFPEFVRDDRYLLAIGIVEPDRATDVFFTRHLSEREGIDLQLSTTAREDGDDWVLNGCKIMPSLASTAKLAVVCAQTEPARPLHEGVTYFLVPTGTPGFEIPHVWDKISQRLVDNATMVFEDCRVPAAQMLGERGTARAAPMTSGGNIEAGATTLGSARGAYEAALAHARERIQGGKPIIEHQAIGMMLAEMATELEAARALIWRAAEAYDEGDKRTPLQTMAKWFAADVAVRVSTKALEIVGSRGIMLDSPVQKYLRDCLSFLHSDGTQQSRLLMIQQRMLADDSFFTTSITS